MEINNSLYDEEKALIQKILDSLISLGKDNNISDSTRASSVFRVLQFLSAMCAAEVATHPNHLKDVCKELHEKVSELAIMIFAENQKLDQL